MITRRPLEMTGTQTTLAWSNLRGKMLLAALAILGSSPIHANDTMNEINLAGEWAFATDAEDVGLEEKWFRKHFDDSIQLPGSMPEQKKGSPVGYDTKFTGSIWKTYPEGKTWADDENYQPFLKEDEFRFPFWLISEFHYIGPAWYQKEVEVPADWEKGNVELSLERPHWETQVWVNDEALGSQDALGVPHRYQVGKHLKSGKNILTIRVDNRLKEIGVGRDAHSISDNTQSNWNGIVGDIKMVRNEQVAVSQVGIFPDIANKSVRLEVSLENTTTTVQAGTLKVSAKLKNAENEHQIEELTTEFEAKTAHNAVTLTYPLGEQIWLWDEFNPHLYELTVSLSSPKGENVWKGDFGLRDLVATKDGLQINGRPLYLRGTLECAIFPKTGYPPTTVEPWERIIRIAQEHGLNHIRFHSWCPPKAAFIAADRMGFYYQVESSAWATDLGSGKPIDKWIYQESERMVAEYGNHPSFCLMPYGNEPHGENHKAYLTEFVKYWQAKDSRHLHTTGAGWPVIPENDFHNIYHHVRIQGWNQNLKSVINAEPPRSDYDWSKALTTFASPVVSHEIGQWCVYPNFNEIPKYDGVLKPTNFKIFRDSLEARGLLHLADDYVQASGKLQALCYKADIEAALRTKGFGGFQLLDLRDFPGQGTALVGILDPFWDSKDYISAKEFRQFCDETVPLARFTKRVFTSNEKVSCRIEVAHYGEQELAEVTPKWKFVDADGRIVREGELAARPLPWGSGHQLGEINEVLPVEEASQFQLQVDVAGFVNTWNFWVYPAQLPETGEEILLTRTLDEKANKALAQGGKVLLSIEKGSIRNGQGGEVGVGFSSIFWNTAWTNGQLPHTLGILCDPAHPALARFPTASHSDWQWWDAMSHSNAISLEGFAEKPQPIVRIIDDWVTNRNLAMLFEMKVGEGSLLISGVDLVSNLETRPEARQLLHSLESYMASDDFAPKTQTSVETIRDLFKPPTALLKQTAQANADNFEKGFEAQNVLDGDPNTMWHTNWTAAPQPHPHHLKIDLGKEVALKGITVLPRQDGNRNGLISDFEIHLSNAPEALGTLLKEGTFPTTTNEHQVLFEQAATGRYLTFISKKGLSENPLSSLAEIGFLLD